MAFFSCWDTAAWEIPSRLAISVITRAEVLAGVKPRSLGRVRRLLDAIPNHPLTAEIADKAAALRRKHRWKLPDAFQAALSRHHKLRLATRDVRDFRPDMHRFVLVPYRLAARVVDPEDSAG